jgi:hypothetical protein
MAAFAFTPSLLRPLAWWLARTLAQDRPGTLVGGLVARRGASIGDYTAGRPARRSGLPGVGGVANEPARVWRVFAVEDGTTRMEQVEIPLEPVRFGAASTLLAGSGVLFRRMDAGVALPRHTATRRQMIVTISGQNEVKTDDGRTLTVRPGVVLVVEDVAGAGHLTRTLPSEDWLGVFIPLDDEATLA